MAGRVNQEKHEKERANKLERRKVVVNLACLGTVLKGPEKVQI
jgi:hypothetical protein